MSGKRVVPKDDRHPPLFLLLPLYLLSDPSAQRMRTHAKRRRPPVRVRKYGTCQVTFATAEQVAVLFPDGTTRTFLARFVKAVA